MARYPLQINGRAFDVDGEPDDNLLSVLRYELGLTGSKFGCGEGVCGACTVFVDGRPIRSCTAQLATVAGKPITTIEGIADGGRLHPVQEAFVEVEAFQCGYCTSGMVMAAIALLRTDADPSEHDIARVMDRNICRCGTYPRMLQAVKLAAQKIKSSTLAGGRP